MLKFNSRLFSIPLSTTVLSILLRVSVTFCTCPGLKRSRLNWPPFDWTVGISRKAQAQTWVQAYIQQLQKRWITNWWCPPQEVYNWAKTDNHWAKFRVKWDDIFDRSSPWCYAQSALQMAQAFERGRYCTVDSDEPVVGNSEIKKLEERVRKLKRMLGRKTMEAIANTLGVSRSNLVERLKGRSKPRGPYNKVEDAVLLPIIRRLVDQSQPMAISGSSRSSISKDEPPINPSSTPSGFIASWATIRCSWRSIRLFTRDMSTTTTTRSWPWSYAGTCAGAWRSGIYLLEK